MLRKNVASQFVHIAGINVSTGAIVSGATWTMRRCLDGTFAAGGATISEDGTTGFYKVALTQADTNGNDIGYFFTATNCVPVTLNVMATTCDPTDSVRFGMTALPNAAADAAGGLPISDAGGLDLDAQRSDVAAILVDTGTTLDSRIPAALVGGRMDCNVQATAASLTFNLAGNITGSLSGSVGSVTGAVGSVTGNVNGNVVGSVASVTAGVTVTTNNDKTGYALSATGSAALTEGYRADGATGTLGEILYEILAHLGESSISGTTKTIKKIDGSTTAATFTLDSATTPTSITRAT